MRNNKILATAMTTALAGALSAGGVNAGTLSVFYPGSTSTEGDDTPRYVATEEIGSDQTLPDDDSGCPAAGSRIQLTYILDNALDPNDTITLELFEGSSLAETAVFQTQTGEKAGASANQVSPGTLEINSSGGSGLFALSGGGEGTNTLTFIVQGDTVAAEGSLTFSFCVDKADLLEEAGQSLSVNLTLSNNDDGGTVPILSSAQGSDATVDATDEDGKIKVDIGGEAGAKKLTGSSLGEDSAILGEICISKNDINGADIAGTTGIYVKGLDKEWTFSLEGYQLVVTDAPFNASIGHTVPDYENSDELTTAIADGSAQIMVFLDVKADSTDGTFDPEEDIPAATVDTTSATFTIDSSIDLDGNNTDGDYLDLLSPEGGKEKCANLIFKVSGNDEIKTHDVPPTGKLTLTFAGDVQREFSGKLNHIKRSGTVCVLYNIPGPNSIENANIRVTNKTATPDGTLIGTLRLPDGTEIFTDYDILTATGLGLIGSNQTIYFNTDMLNTIAQSASNPNGAWTDGWKRAILRLETNLNTVEMMALIRDDDVLGAPLMNMSTGASGNGCGR
jgi:hypothetical protein